jgi:hypothetical protein
MFDFYSILNGLLLVIFLSFFVRRSIKQTKKLSPVTQGIIFRGNYILITMILSLAWNQIYMISQERNKPWDSKEFKTIKSLDGNNVEIVPPGVKGYIIDSMCTSNSKNGSARLDILIKKIRANAGQTIHASAYIYTTEDFNGDSVKIVLKGALKGSGESTYRLSDAETDSSKFIHNLLYNGNFENGRTNWIPNADSTTHTIIDTPFGKGIRVSRGNGNSLDWSLKYAGRPIIYHEGHTYQIKFIFKVQKGPEIPFSIGWWIDIPNHAYSLPLNINQLSDGWKEANCSYKFKETCYNLYTFLNGLQNNSVVDIANVEITDLDKSDTLVYFVDQLSQKGKWQKVTLDAPCESGKISYYISISKKGVTDLKSLKGKVIFSKPELAIIK